MKIGGRHFMHINRLFWNATVLSVDPGQEIDLI